MNQPYGFMTHAQYAAGSYLHTNPNLFHPVPGTPLIAHKSTTPNLRATSPTSISNFACSPTDLHVIDAILAPSSPITGDDTDSNILIDQMVQGSLFPQCSFCGRISLTQTLNTIHIQESCHLNPSSTYSLSRAKEPIVVPAHSAGKRGSLKKKKKGQEDDKELTNSMMSSITTGDAPMATVKRRTKKVPILNLPTKGTIPIVVQPPIYNSNILTSNNEISLSTPAVSDGAQLASAMLMKNPPPISSFSLQRTKVFSLNPTNLSSLALKKSNFKQNVIECVTQGIDHIIRSSLASRRRLAAVTPTTSIGVFSSNISSPVSPLSTSPTLEPLVAKKRKTTKLQAGPVSRLPPALSMPEI